MEKVRRIALFCACLLIGQTCNSQPPVVHDDGSVTFRYCGKAKRVAVLGDFQYANSRKRYTDHNRKVKMHREGDSCFCVTTKPLVPETYTYCFRINGKRQPDPLNSDSAWQMMHKWSILSVGGTEQADLYLPVNDTTVHGGQLIRTSWYSTEEQISRRVNIYLPAAYNADSRFPILYLLHGINGYEGSLAERGRAMQIEDNLIAKGKIAPIIVVMPDCNVNPQEDHPSHHTLFNNIMHYTQLCRDRRIEKAIAELIMAMNTTYHTASNCAIAGLSDGGRIATNVARRCPTISAQWGCFHPSSHTTTYPHSPKAGN